MFNVLMTIELAPVVAGTDCAYSALVVEQPPAKVSSGVFLYLKLHLPVLS
jgi:hypothetical protein